MNKSDKYLLKRRKAIGNAIRTQAEAYLADGTISTEPRGKDKVTGKGVDNYASGAVKLSPDPQKEEEKQTKSMQYAHHLLKGSTLSEAQKRMIEMYDEKKKKEELAKKDKVSSMMTKTSVKKEDEKEEEKPDLRSKYAMINLIKNKLRAAGQRDPMVMAVDACEEVVNEDEKKKIETMIKTKKMNGKDLTPEQLQGLDAGLTQGGNSSVLNPPKPEAKKIPPKPEAKKYNPYGSGTANPSNMAPGKP